MPKKKDGNPGTALVKRPKSGLAKSEQRKDTMWQLIDKKMGGKGGFVAACEASVSPKAKKLLELFADKAYATWGTKKLAQKAEMTAAEVVDLFRDRKWLETTIAIHEELPSIVRDAASDAKSSMKPCSDCKGTKMQGDVLCWVCAGLGEVRRPGDKDKLAFVGEAAGITGKRGGPLVQVNTQINNNGQQGVSFEDLMRRAAPIRPKPIVLESEVIDVEEVPRKSETFIS